MLRALADLILPRRCAGCGDPGELLCPACAPVGPAIVVPGLGGLAAPVRAAGRYEGGLRAALLAYKERGRLELAGPLAGLLAGVAARFVRPGVVLVPVPSAAAAARRRGGDHVLRLARPAGARLGVAVVPALRLARRVDDSAGLDGQQRRANLAGAMCAHAPPPGAVAVLVDDIVTTGVTVQESLRALRAAGWPVLGAAALAATPRRR